MNKSKSSSLDLYGKAVKLFGRDDFCVVLILLFSIPFLWKYVSYDFGRDQGFYTFYGSLLLKGYVPYRDFFELNFPGGMYLHAIVIKTFGRSIFSFRLFDFLFQVTFSCLLYRFTKYFVDRKTALLGCFFYLAFYFTSGFWDTGQRDCFTVPFLILSPLLLFRGLDSENNFLLLMAGSCDAIAVFIKPVYGTLLMGQCIYLTIHELNGQGNCVKTCFKKLLFYLSGFAMPVIAYALYLRANSALEPFVNGLLFAKNCYAGSNSLVNCFENFVSILNANYLRTTIALFGLLALIFNSKRRKKTVFLICTIIWISIPLFIQNKFYMYHIIPTLMGVSILISSGIFFIAGKKKWVQGFIIVALFSLCLNDIMPGGFIEYLKLAYNAKIDVSGVMTERSWYVRSIKIEKISSFVKNNTNSEDKIYVCSLDPVIYYFSQREPASRLSTVYFFIKECGKMQELEDSLYKTFMLEMHKNMPKVIFIPVDKHVGGVKIGFHNIPHTERFKNWYNFLHNNYTEVQRIGFYRVYVLNAQVS